MRARKMHCVRCNIKNFQRLVRPTNINILPKIGKCDQNRLTHSSSTSLRANLLMCGLLAERNLGFNSSPVLLLASCRWKSKKKQTSTKKEQEDESDSEDDEAQEEQDWSQGKDSKVITLSIASMRTDLLLKASLNMARNKVETLFYESKIRVNGSKLLKKSALVHVGDEVDVIRGPSPENPDHFLLVTRIHVLSAVERNTERLAVKVRRYPKLTIEDYDKAPTLK